MNERIRQLAKESDLDWHKHWNDDESNRLEKFAELIVAECVGVAVDNGCSDFVDIEHLLLKHFGVKE